MARNIKKDYEELPAFSKFYSGEKAVECIEAYAKKRRVVEHRICTAFWDCVEEGLIIVETRADGYEYIK